MAVIVLASTMSFTVNKHYCGRFLVDSAVFSVAKTCKMKMATHQMQTNSSCEVSKKSCCTDKHINIEGQDELKTNWEHLSLEQQQFITTLAFSLATLFIEDTTDKKQFKPYRPPLIVKEIHKLDEVYLI